QHELGVAKRAADEVLLAGLRVPDESRPAQHAQWDAALWVEAGLQSGFLAGGRRRTHVLGQCLNHGCDHFLSVLIRCCFMVTQPTHDRGDHQSKTDDNAKQAKEWCAKEE